MPMDLQGVQLEVRMDVVDNFSQSVLLGQTVLLEHQGDINFQHRTVSVKTSD